MQQSTASKLTFTTFKTGWGWMGVLAADKGLLRITLPQASLKEVSAELGDRISLATNSPHLFIDFVSRIINYFRGNKATFPDDLDFSEATDFQRRVWQTTRSIPCGETRSYSWVAAQIGAPEAVRAVGQALGRNPLPIIIPCHRVMGSDGKLCGFAGGLPMKERLLKLER